MGNRISAGFAAAPIFAGLASSAVQALLVEAVEVDLAPSEVLIREGAPSEAVFVVLQGRLDASVRDGDGTSHLVGHLDPGDLVGETSLITGGTATATVTATGPARLARLPQAAFDALVEEHPDVLEAVVGIVTERLLRTGLARALRRLFGDVDPHLLQRMEEAATWRHLARGERLFDEGDAADGWYVLVSGTLLAIRGEAEVLNEMHSGAVVGEIALLTGQTRSASVVAKRPSHVARFDAEVFERLVLEAPENLLAIVRALLVRLSRRVPRAETRDLNVVLLPLSPDAPARRLADGIAEALAGVEPVAVLDAGDCASLGILGDPRSLPVDHTGWLRLATWLEERHRDQTTVLLVANAEDDAWNRWILAAADRVVLVGDGVAPPPAGGHARLPSVGTAPWDPTAWLVLAHPQDTALPRGTRAWLDRWPVSAHFHVRLPRGGEAPTGASRGDLGRLARHLVGRAVGLALSGGVSRGFAHVGVARALQEAGIPIDFIAGASAGALNGALLAYGQDMDALVERIAEGVRAQGPPFGDYTLPMVALLRSKRIRHGIEHAFGGTRLEDLWIPVAVVVTDLATAEKRVFERGLAWPIVLASSSPPGVTVPVLVDGNLCCDGGLVDNLPLDIVEARGCRFHLACSASAKFALDLPGEEFPSPWTMLWDRALGGGRTADVPTVIQIMVQSTTLASTRELPAIRERAHLYLEPPVERFDPLDFSDPKALVACGYEYAAALLREHPAVAEIIAAIRPSEA